MIKVVTYYQKILLNFNNWHFYQFVFRNFIEINNKCYLNKIAKFIKIGSFVKNILEKYFIIKIGQYRMMITIKCTMIFQLA